MIVQNFFQTNWETVVRNTQHIKEETNNLLTKSNTRIIQPTLQTIKKYSPSFQQGLTTLENIAIRTLKVVISIALFSVQPTFFLVGIAVTIAFPEAMRSSIERISKVWDSLPWPLKVLAFVPFPFSWPSYFLITAPFIGANVCLYFQDKAGIQRQDPQPPSTTPPATEVPRFTPCSNNTSEIYPLLFEAIRSHKNEELQSIQSLLNIILGPNNTSEIYPLLFEATRSHKNEELQSIQSLLNIILGPNNTEQQNLQHQATAACCLDS